MPVSQEIVVVVYPLGPTFASTLSQRGSIVLPPAVIVYEPGGSENAKAPSASEFPIINGVLELVRYTSTAVA